MRVDISRTEEALHLPRIPRIDMVDDKAHTHIYVYVIFRGSQPSFLQFLGRRSVRESDLPCRGSTETNPRSPSLTDATYYLSLWSWG